MYEKTKLIEGLRQLAGYAVASALALAVDIGLLALMTRGMHVDDVLAATVSFMLGAAVAYGVSTRLAFREHRLTNTRTEFACFVAIGVVGLVINDCVIALGTGVLGMNLFVAKGCATGLTFTCNFTLRRKLLFTPIPPKQEVSNAADQA